MPLALDPEHMLMGRAVQDAPDRWDQRLKHIPLLALMLEGLCGLHEVDVGLPDRHKPLWSRRLACLLGLLASVTSHINYAVQLSTCCARSL